MSDTKEMTREEFEAEYARREACHAHEGPRLFKLSWPGGFTCYIEAWSLDGAIDRYAAHAVLTARGQRGLSPPRVESMCHESALVPIRSPFYARHRPPDTPTPTDEEARAALMAVAYPDGPTRTQAAAPGQPPAPSQPKRSTWGSLVGLVATWFRDPPTPKPDSTP